MMNSLFSRAFYKFCRKLKLKSALYKLFPPRDARKNAEKIRPVSQKEYLNAVGYLNEINKDAHSSMICEERDIVEEYDLDVIIPVYNTKEYLSECINSVLFQKTKYSFRLIIVDDGSTDGSGEVLKNSWGRVDNVLIISRQNGGHAAARNTALMHVRARYIAFVDSDDVMAEGAIENLLSAAYANDADCVQGGYVMFSGDGEESVLYKDRECEMYGNYPNYVWGKVYKSRLWNGLCFPEGYWYEDTMAYHAFVFRIKKYFTVSPVVYRYRLHENSISHLSRFKTKAVDSLYVVLQCYRDNMSLGNVFTERNYIEQLEQILISARRLECLGGKINRAAFKVLRGYVLGLYKSFPAPKGDANLLALENAILCNRYLAYRLCVCG